jgi:hypothetical protein
VDKPLPVACTTFYLPRMRSPRISLLVLGLTVACASTPPAPVPPTVPLPATIHHADATSTTDASTTPAAPTFSIAEPLATDHGVIFAAVAGEAVVLHPAQGADVALTDGERVVFVDENVGVGGGDSTAVVEARGVRGTIPNARVITEARLQRSSDNRLAIFTAIASCGDFCHGEVWQVSPVGARTRITDNAGPDVHIAWSPDHTRVAIGAGGLYVVTLQNGHTEEITSVTSPSWAPDNALFARGVDADDAVFAVTPGTAPVRVFAPPGRPPRPGEGMARPDPSPVVFEQEGAILRAEFHRGARTITVRSMRDGRPAPALAPLDAATLFVREQMAACNAARLRLRETAVFPDGTTVSAVRRVPPRSVLVRIARPGVDPVEVSVTVSARQIDHPRGANVALPGGLDFCPPAVWRGPQND